MRDILFRGKTEKGKWVYGGIAFQEDGAVAIVGTLDKYYSVYDLGLNTDYVIPETVGQYTELTDKNGNRIFEGDILESRISENAEDWKVWIVGFEDGTFVFESVRKSVKSRRKYRYEMNMICADEVNFYGLVLVGNIHDTPELLK